MTTYSAVRTTGIYCRPGCGGRPRAENVVTFELAAAAEAAGYRACLACRPYRVAGPVSAAAPGLVCRGVQLIIAGALDEGTEDDLGRRLGVSARHLRRLFNQHLGVTPNQFALSRRAHFARRLLDDSDLSITQVAFASGFGSVRHFNRAMRDVFRSSPRDLRARRRRHDRLVIDGGLALRIPVDPPFNWTASLRFLARRAILGVESVSSNTYRRTVVLDGDAGVLELTSGGPDHVVLRAHLPHWEGVIHVVERAGQMLGTDVDVALGETVLAADPVLGRTIRAQPGVRLPGAWGLFEMGVQSIIGHSLDAASTSIALAAMVRAHGTPVSGLGHGLTHAFPSAEIIARTDLADCQLPRQVSDTVVAFALALAAGAIILDRAAPHNDLVSSLTAIPHLDTSTAQMIALHLGHPDAFPHADPQVRAALRHLAPASPSPDELAERWRPWRALAATHLIALAEALDPHPQSGLP